MNKPALVVDWFVTESWIKDNGSPLTSVGWGNGYIVVDKTHPWFGKEYDEIMELDTPVEFTYSGHGNTLRHAPKQYQSKDYWVFGFDTCHYGMNKQNWPKERVEKEAQNLCERAFMKWVEHNKTYEDGQTRKDGEGEAAPG